MNTALPIHQNYFYEKNNRTNFITIYSSTSIRTESSGWTEKMEFKPKIDDN